MDYISERETNLKSSVLLFNRVWQFKSEQNQFTETQWWQCWFETVYFCFPSDFFYWLNLSFVLDFEIYSEIYTKSIVANCSHCHTLLLLQNQISFKFKKEKIKGLKTYLVGRFHFAIILVFNHCELKHFGW